MKSFACQVVQNALQFDTVGAKIKFWFRSQMTAVEWPVPQVTNATGSVFQRCCDGTNIAFTLISKYTVHFRKGLHCLYGTDHEVLYLR